MASAALVLAAQTNGKRSKGPATPEGKQKSAANSRKHGLFSKTIRTDEQCERLFNRIHPSFLAEFHPASPFEKNQVEAMALSQARYQWAVRMSTSVLNSEIETDTATADPQLRAHLAWQRVSAAMDRLLRLQFRFQRDYFNALDRLRESQERNERTESGAQAPEFDNGKTKERTGSTVRQALPPLGLAPRAEKMNERTEPESGLRLNQPVRASGPDPRRAAAKPIKSTMNRRALPGIPSLYKGRRKTGPQSTRRTGPSNFRRTRFSRPMVTRSVSPPGHLRSGGDRRLGLLRRHCNIYAKRIAEKARRDGSRFVSSARPAESMPFAFGRVTLRGGL